MSNTKHTKHPQKPWSGRQSKPRGFFCHQSSSGWHHGINEPSRHAENWTLLIDILRAPTRRCQTRGRSFQSKFNVSLPTWTDPCEGPEARIGLWNHATLGFFFWYTKTTHTHTVTNTRAHTISNTSSTTMKSETSPCLQYAQDVYNKLSAYIVTTKYKIQYHHSSYILFFYIHTYIHTYAYTHTISWIWHGRTHIYVFTCIYNVIYVIFDYKSIIYVYMHMYVYIYMYIYIYTIHIIFAFIAKCIWLLDTKMLSVPLSDGSTWDAVATISPCRCRKKAVWMSLGVSLKMMVSTA